VEVRLRTDLLKFMPSGVRFQSVFLFHVCFFFFSSRKKRQACKFFFWIVSGERTLILFFPCSILFCTTHFMLIFYAHFFLVFLLPHFSWPSPSLFFTQPCPALASGNGPPARVRPGHHPPGRRRVGLLQRVGNPLLGPCARARSGNGPTRTGCGLYTPADTWGIRTVLEGGLLTEGKETLSFVRRVLPPPSHALSSAPLWSWHR